MHSKSSLELLPSSPAMPACIPFPCIMRNACIHNRKPDQSVHFLIVQFYRLLWTLIVLGASGGFIYYICNRVSVYLRYDTTVKVVVNYSEDMAFPTVTVCNQNAFKSVHQPLSSSHVLPFLFVGWPKRCMGDGTRKSRVWSIDPSNNQVGNSFLDARHGPVYYNRSA
jgi:hypothetical protein